MIVTFFGHAQFLVKKEYESAVLSILEEKIGDKSADIYLGGYGEFDNFAYYCCKKYKTTHPNISLLFVTPYITTSYQENHLEYEKNRYDAILYPPIENKPPRFAIVYRNQWMIDQADLIFFGITKKSGGAYKTYQYAKSKKKEILNLTGIHI